MEADPEGHKFIIRFLRLSLKKKIKGYPRFIFLLTDSTVSSH